MNGDRIIDHVTPPDFARLRAIAREIRRRLRRPRPDSADLADPAGAEAERLGSLTLLALCLEAWDALFPGRHKV